MIRNLLVFGLAIMMMSSCVPARKLVYFQKDDLKNRKEIPRDSVVRTHQLQIQEYKIQPLDMLFVSFETLTDESDAFDFLSKLSPQSRMGTGQGNNLSGILVNRDGEIEYAVLGKIKVANLTPFQAEDTIRSRALKFIPDVIVRVRLLNFRFTVLGEVNGEKTVTSTNSRLTISEALGLAGGLTELADRSLVKVIRQKDSTAEIFYINLLEEKFIESPYYYVQQNDVIVVPPLRQRTFKKYFTANLGLITATLSFAYFVYSLSNN